MTHGQSDVAGAVSLHASAIVLGEAGILILGASGAGKSRLALALIAAAEQRRLFGRLVGDDRIALAPQGGRLVARGHPRVAGQIECRGQGILDMAFEGATVLRLVVDLVGPEQRPPRYPTDETPRWTHAGLELPKLVLQAGAVRQDQAAAVFTFLRKTRQI